MSRERFVFTDYEKQRDVTLFALRDKKKELESIRSKNNIKFARSEDVCDFPPNVVCESTNLYYIFQGKVRDN